MDSCSQLVFLDHAMPFRSFNGIPEPLDYAAAHGSAGASIHFIAAPSGADGHPVAVSSDLRGVVRRRILCSSLGRTKTTARCAGAVGGADLVLGWGGSLSVGRVPAFDSSPRRMPALTDGPDCFQSVASG